MDDNQAEPTLADELASLDGETSEAAARTDDQSDAAAKTETDQDATDQTAADETDDPEGDDDEGKRKRVPRSQRLKRQVEALRAEVESLRNRQPQADVADLGKAVEAEVGAPPQEKDFADYLAYERALTAYEVKKVLAEERVKQRVNEQSARQQAEVLEMVEDFRDRQEQARKAIPDYDKVLKAARVPVSPHVERLILESEKGAELAYHLAKSPEKLERLNTLSPLKAAMEIGSLASRLSLPNAKRATNAPSPVNPVKGGAGVASPSQEIDAYISKTYGRKG